jgi:hypothetical protein
MNNTVTISKETLQKLLDNLYEVCSICDELDIYEHDELDDAMQEAKEWADDKFGRTIDKEVYE